MSRAAAKGCAKGAGLPTLETLTVAYFDLARQSGHRNVSRWLKSRGYQVYLRYWRDYPVGDEQLGEVVVIASVSLDPACRGRGWFWRYCQLCAALAGDGVVVEAVANERLRQSLAKRPEFEAINPASFLLRNRTPGTWPLSFPPGAAGSQDIDLRGV